ncbi:unnamed protein product, partial [Lymnaea stagnalis]
MPKMTEKGNVLQLKLWHYLLLCASLFSNEVTVTFYFLYMVTWGQMLGLSTQVVTFPGVVSACLSFIVIPVMGKFGDRGNVHKRKSFLLLVSGGLQVIGASCLIIACVVKIVGSSGFKLDANIDKNYHRQIKTAEIKELLLNSSETARDEGRISMEGDPDKLDSRSNQSEHRVITATLAFIAFVLMDCGYDTGSSNIRGFVMECVDPSQHSKLLTIGVVMSGIGGCALALMGLIEYDGLTGPSSDPALAKAIALSILLIICVIVSNFTTLALGRYLVNKQMALHVDPPTSKQMALHVDTPTSKQMALHVDTPTSKQMALHVDTPTSKAMALHIDPPTSKDVSTGGLNITEHGSITKCSLRQQIQTQTISCEIQSYSTRFFQEISNIPVHIQSLLGCKKSILLLLSCLLCFFTSGSVMSFELFYGNFLAQEVYHGDWDAPANSKAKKNFEKALKTASIGAFLVQSMFLLYTIFHEKIGNVLGPLMEFFLVSFVNIALVLSLALTNELY